MTEVASLTAPSLATTIEGKDGKDAVVDDVFVASAAATSANTSVNAGVPITVGGEVEGAKKLQELQERVDSEEQEQNLGDASLSDVKREEEVDVFERTRGADVNTNAAVPPIPANQEETGAVPNLPATAAIGTVIDQATNNEATEANTELNTVTADDSKEAVLVHGEDLAKAVDLPVEEGEEQPKEDIQEGSIKEKTIISEEDVQKPVEVDTPAQESSSISIVEINPVDDTKPASDAQQIVEHLQETPVKEESSSTNEVALESVETGTSSLDPPLSGTTTGTATKPADDVKPASDVQPKQAEELAKEEHVKVEETVRVADSIVPASAEPTKAEVTTSEAAPTEQRDSEVKGDAPLTEGTPVGALEPVAVTKEPSATPAIAETEVNPMVSTDASRQPEVQSMDTEPVKELTPLEEPLATTIQEISADRTEAPASETVTVSVVKESNEAEVKPHEAEIADEVPKGSQESTKDERPVDVGPVVAEESSVTNGPAPTETSTAGPVESVSNQGVIPEATAYDAATKAYGASHAHVNDEVDFDKATEEEIKAASQDIVTETEETKEVVTEKSISASEAETKEENASIPPASESGVESLSSIPSESGEASSATPEEHAVPSIPTSEEVAKQDEGETKGTEVSEVPAVPVVSETQSKEEPEAPPEIEATKPEATGPNGTPAKEPTEDAKPESITGEEESVDVMEATSTKPGPAADPEIKVQENEKVVISDAPASKETAEVSAPAPSVDVDIPSDELVVPAPEENKEVPTEAPKEVEAPAPTNKVEEPTGPPSDTPVEPVVDVVADASHSVNDIVEPKEEPSPIVGVPAASEIVDSTSPTQDSLVVESSQVEVKEEAPVSEDAAKDLPQEEVKEKEKETEEPVPPADVSADATATDEATVPASVTQEALKSEPPQVERQEESAVSENAAQDGEEEEVKDVQKQAEESIPVTAAEEGLSAPAQEPGSLEVPPSGEVRASEESAPIKGADATKEDAAQETPVVETRAFEAGASSTDTPIPPVSVEADKPEPESADTITESEPSNIPPPGESTDTPAEESGVPSASEVDGVVEPVGTPATVGLDDKAARSAKKADEEEQPEDVPAGDLPKADVQAEEPVLAPAPEEPVKGAVPATTAEIVEETIAKQEPEGNTPDAPAVQEGAKLPQPEELPDSPVPQSQEPIEPASVVSEAPAVAPEGSDITPQTKAEPGTASLNETSESETIIPIEDTQQATEVVPNVLVETPTPVSETLTVLPDEDEGESVPVELRLAKAIGISPEELVKLPALSTSSEVGVIGTEDEARTPTPTKDEVTPDEGEIKEEVARLGPVELQTPTQSVIRDKPETEEAPAPAGPNVDTEISEVPPERPRSPWTPSYSVTQQGISPVHPEPIEEPVVEKAAEVAAEEAVPEKVEEATTEAVAPISEEPEQPLETAEPAVTETEVSEEAVPAEPSQPERLETVLKDVGREESPAEAEIVQTETSEEVAEDGKPEVPAEVVPNNLTVYTSTKDVPDRPKSPWTPSYTVTKLGPGVPEPEELHLDADAVSDATRDAAPAPEPVQQVTAVPDVHVEAAKAPESVPDVERPKSPFPVSYSVTQQGPGGVEEATPATEVLDNIPHEDTVSIANSNEPEAPLTPRSELGAITPGFDSLSEVSEASHIPNAPSSPRTDPDVRSLASAEVMTPLVSGAEVPGAPVSPFHTPLLAQKTLEVFDPTEPLTEYAVSGVTTGEKAGTPGTATESWIQETNGERESYIDSETPAAEVSEEKDVAEIEDIQSETVGEVAAEAVATTTTNDEPLEQKDVQKDAQEPPAPTPELTVPKVDVTSQLPPAPPVIVTNTLSTDSAFTQFSRTFSTSQETTATDITTPDVETMSVPKLKGEGSEIESLDEERTVTHVSEEPKGSDTVTSAAAATNTRTPHGTQGKSLGITHTLAMRSFPSAFAQSESPSTSEQPNQAPEVENDTPELDDQLSPLSPSRRRLESTASALAFPGGWVSSPSHKERASLEVATGVFSKPVFEGKAISSSSSSATGTTSANENGKKEEEKESGWRCVIM